nr:MAG TPA: hypothetical protein [Caudoviricetes sp.]
MILSPLEQACLRHDVLVTTVDNPINPFVDFEGWMNLDIAMGYDTCSLVNQMFMGYDNMSDEDQAIEYARMIRDLFAHDPLGVYTLAKRPSWREVPSTSAVE